MTTPNDTTYCIYRIVCFQTGKVYVGQTRNRTTRRSTHFRELKQNKHHSPKLQNAYNKYGGGSFFFEILEKDVTEYLVDDREIFWISYFNSFRDGYNMTPGGEHGGGNRKPIEWGGIEYDSLRAAARANNISQTSMSRYIKCGFTCDDDVIRRGEFLKIRCSWNGISYDSLGECAEANNITTSAMTLRLDRGYTCDADMPGSLSALTPNPKECEWNGIKYRSHTECADANNITVSGMILRLNKGYVCDSDMPTQRGNAKKRPCVWNGVEYATIKEAAIANNLEYGTMGRRIRQGNKTNSDVVSNHQKRCFWNGMEYPSVREAAKAIGISFSAMGSRLRRGLTCDDDMVNR